MPDQKVDIAVIGGGAAGFFAAIYAAENSHIAVKIFEKTQKLLSKVRISGGGRCNVAHDCYHPGQLVKNFPRGGKKLYKAFQQFATEDTLNFFRERGVNFKTESDGRIFPTTDSSQTIIDTLVNEADRRGVAIQRRTGINQIDPVDEGYRLKSTDGTTCLARKVIITPGGHPKPAAYQWLMDLGLSVKKPFPSLFTFNVPDSGLTDLQGLSVDHGEVRIAGTKLSQQGPVLITHWGFSGPAVIKLSAFAAETLYEQNYHFPFLINWCGLSDAEVRKRLADYREAHPKKQVAGNPLFAIPARLWKRLCEKSGIQEDQPFHEVGKKMTNRLVEFLVRDPYNAKGKTTYKEEFVTAGGVELKEVNPETFESKKLPGLYLAGEVLNVDGVTGGFNFQHAWTSGYLVGKNAGMERLGD